MNCANFAFSTGDFSESSDFGESGDSGKFGLGLFSRKSHIVEERYIGCDACLRTMCMKIGLKY